MKKLLVTLSLFAFATLGAQTKDYVGKWELCKIVTAKGDTIRIKSSDARYITYNFEYNNTFTSFIKEKDEEATGRWGFDFANKTIKIKNPVYTKTKTKIGDYGIVVHMITPINLIESREEKKKQISYWIYCRVK
jgi:hypothetical protein